MNFSEKRVLVTGATGLIGRELAIPLREAGFEVYAITIDEDNPANGFRWIKGNLFDGDFVKRMMAEIRPTHLLNLAWTTTGDYLTSDLNYGFLAAGIELARNFADHGGKRAVYAGTCFEYKFKDYPIAESDELDAGKFPYTFCKNSLRGIVDRYFSDHGVSFGYGRIFYVYGRGEAKSRLMGMVVDKLSRSERIVINSGPLVKDYLYARDVAGAFTALLNCDVQGCVNVCSGIPISIRDLVMSMARKMGKESLVDFVDKPSGQPPIIVGSNARLLNEVGYCPKFSVDSAVTDILS